jgi:uncharacterized membrane protein
MAARRQSTPRVIRIARAHLRLWISVALGILVYLLLPSTWTSVTRMLAGWDIGVGVYLAAALVMMARSPASAIKRHAAAQDEGAFGLLVLTVGAALASFGAIFAELAAIDRSQPHYGLYIALALATILFSWTFTHVIFALHYAYEYYGEGRRVRGLKFPGDDEPDYWDFVYFSLVIGMTFQVSDVSVADRGTRRTVAVHGLLSFLFYTAIVALAVNIASNALQS